MPFIAHHQEPGLCSNIIEIDIYCHTADSYEIFDGYNKTSLEIYKDIMIKKYLLLMPFFNSNEQGYEGQGHAASTKIKVRLHSNLDLSYFTQQC